MPAALRPGVGWPGAVTAGHRDGSLCLPSQKRRSHEAEEEAGVVWYGCCSWCCESGRRAAHPLTRLFHDTRVASYPSSPGRHRGTSGSCGELRGGGKGWSGVGLHNVLRTIPHSLLLLPLFPDFWTLPWSRSRTWYSGPLARTLCSYTLLLCPTLRVQPISPTSLESLFHTVLLVFTGLDPDFSAVCHPITAPLTLPLLSAVLTSDSSLPGPCLNNQVIQKMQIEQKTSNPGLEGQHSLP